jgi:hypothetical protein|tara:strand:- start:322 stop:819 length:498 start_codon:yes stop_codon:yes gene_type:complete
MAIISFEIPDSVSHLKLSPTQEKNIKNKLRGQYLGEIAEAHAIRICEKKFGVKFNLGKYNSEGFDVISEDGSIVVEVKQTSCVMPDGSKRLQIQSFMNKFGKCTHILILDYSSFKGCILEHDDFFYNTHHYPTKSFWRWDSEYNMKGSKRCAENTKWFLNNLVEL